MPWPRFGTVGWWTPWSRHLRPRSRGPMHSGQFQENVGFRSLPSCHCKNGLNFKPILLLSGANLELLTYLWWLHNVFVHYNVCFSLSTFIISGSSRTHGPIEILYFYAHAFVSPFRASASVSTRTGWPALRSRHLMPRSRPGRPRPHPWWPLCYTWFHRE